MVPPAAASTTPGRIRDVAVLRSDLRNFLIWHPEEVKAFLYDLVDFEEGWNGYPELDRRIVRDLDSEGRINRAWFVGA